MHLLSLHTMPVNMTCLPIFGTHYIYVLTLFLHETTSLLYPASITYDESHLFVTYCILFLACCHVLLLIWSNTFVRAPFELGRVILVASFIWCLACSASNLLKCLLLSYRIIGVNMSHHPVFHTYSILASCVCLSSE